MTEIVNHNGVDMNKEWVLEIEKAQKLTMYVINGTEYKRIRFGEEKEDWGWDHPCHDCGVIRGQYHVPMCDVERCPRCDGQSISCECEYERDK